MLEALIAAVFILFLVGGVDLSAWDLVGLAGLMFVVTCFRRIAR